MNDKFTLEQVLKFAKNGELKNLAIVDDYSAMCDLINRVLIELHARFVINQQIIDIPLEKDKTAYNLYDYL